ncbi:MAG: hypothetical protein QMC80_08185 [Thermoplasmatales archaeon]|nr:hypothetical protein [Thermoplasmatales archaeon]
MKMTVKKSAVKGEGIARIHEAVLDSLTIHSGENIVVSSSAKSILVTVFGDTLIGKNDIRLRENDMKKLDVKKGDRVDVEEYKKISDVAKDEMKRFGKKLNLKRKIIKARDIIFG